MKPSLYSVIDETGNEIQFTSSEGAGEVLLARLSKRPVEKTCEAIKLKVRLLENNAVSKRFPQSEVIYIPRRSGRGELFDVKVIPGIGVQGEVSGNITVIREVCHQKQVCGLEPTVVVQALHESLHKLSCLDHVAETLCLDKMVLVREFEEVFGKSIVEFINSLRVYNFIIDMAKGKANNASTVSEYGFSNWETFRKNFTKVFGFHPLLNSCAPAPARA